LLQVGVWRLERGRFGCLSFPGIKWSPEVKPKSCFAMLGPSIRALTGMNECCRRELASQVDASPRSLAFRKLSSGLTTVKDCLMDSLKGLAERLLPCFKKPLHRRRAREVVDPETKTSSCQPSSVSTTVHIMAIQPTCSDTSTNNYCADSLVTQVPKNLLPLLRLGDLVSRLPHLGPSRLSRTLGATTCQDLQLLLSGSRLPRSSQDRTFQSPRSLRLP